jgi:hypothetical protein
VPCSILAVCQCFRVKQCLHLHSWTLLTSAPKMEAVCFFSKTLTYGQNTAWCNNPEDRHLQCNYNSHYWVPKHQTDAKQALNFTIWHALWKKLNIHVLLCSLTWSTLGVGFTTAGNSISYRLVSWPGSSSSCTYSNHNCTYTCTYFLISIILGKMWSSHNYYENGCLLECSTM